VCSSDGRLSAAQPHLGKTPAFSHSKKLLGRAISVACAEGNRYLDASERASALFEQIQRWRDGGDEIAEAIDKATPSAILQIVSVMRASDSYYQAVSSVAMGILASMLFTMLRKPPELESLRTRMKSYASLMNKLGRLVKKKQSEAQVTQSIVEGWWKGLKDRGVVV
jgi:hypothetical protein